MSLSFSAAGDQYSDSEGRKREREGADDEDVHSVAAAAEQRPRRGEHDHIIIIIIITIISLSKLCFSRTLNDLVVAGPWGRRWDAGVRSSTTSCS